MSVRLEWDGKPTRFERISLSFQLAVRQSRLRRPGAAWPVAEVRLAGFEPATSRSGGARSIP